MIPDPIDSAPILLSLLLELQIETIFLFHDSILDVLKLLDRPQHVMIELVRRKYGHLSPILHHFVDFLARFLIGPNPTVVVELFLEVLVLTLTFALHFFEAN